MTDILKIALDNRARLHEETAKLNEFIRYGETLLRESKNGDRTVTEMPRRRKSSRTDDDASDDAEAARPEVIRRGA